MTERARNAQPPQTAEDTNKHLEASLVLVRLAAYKACACCGRVFATRADFERLPLCGSGYQPEFDDNGDQRTDVRLCLRNCSCNSTLSVEVPCPAPDVDDDEPCDVCSIVGGHDEDVHAEHDETRRADREFNAFDGARFDGGGE
jgi:hypothetical protein